MVFGSLGFALSSFALSAPDLFDSKLVIGNVIVISIALFLAQAPSQSMYACSDVVRLPSEDWSFNKTHSNGG